MNIQFLELLVIACVLGLLSFLYARSHADLRLQIAGLNIEAQALETAERNLSFGRLREAGAKDIEDALEHAGSGDSALALRVRALHRGATGFGEGALVSVEEARFWTSAFVFIGLIGTLVCLTIAVLNLIALVKGAGAGSSASVASSFQGVVTSMTNVFSGMGVAFASTALGTGFTLVLGKQVNAVENRADVIEARIERFLALEAAPLVALAREKRAAVAKHDEFQRETARLENAAQLLESAAIGLAEAINAAKKSIQNLGNTSTQAGDKMERAADKIGSSATRFAQGADALTGMTGELDRRLATLGTLIENHNAEQNKWRDGTDGVLSGIRETVARADGAFERFDSVRSSLETMNKNTDRMLDETRQLAFSIDANSRAAVVRLGEDAGRSLGEIRRAIETGNEQERELLDNLRSLCGVLSDYAQHVEDEIRRLPAVVGSEPLLLLEQRESNGWQTLAGHLGSLQNEFTRVGAQLASSRDGHLSGAQFQAGLGALEGKLDGLKSATPASAPQLGEMKSQISALQDSVAGVNSDVRRLSTSVAHIAQNGVPFQWPWSKRS